MTRHDIPYIAACILLFAAMVYSAWWYVGVLPEWAQ